MSTPQINAALADLVDDESQSMRQEAPKKYYVEKRIYKKLTITEFGKEVNVPVSSMGNGIIGVLLVYGNEQSAKKRTSDSGYIVVEEAND